ncbi:MAG: superoxide dismutase [Cu-Zn] SodC [Burkholderiales bacterium]
MIATRYSAGFVLLFLASAANADEVIVTINKIDGNGVGAAIGTVTLSDGPDGLVLKPDLKELAPGEHGFHVHGNPDCGAANNAAGMAAGGHHDPAKAGKHLGPKGSGHLGDLPALMVAADGSATQSMTAARLKVADVKGRSLMIHAGGDNYSDEPKPLGGGGARVACGVIK